MAVVVQPCSTVTICTVEHLVCLDRRRHRYVAQRLAGVNGSHEEYMAVCAGGRAGMSSSGGTAAALYRQLKLDGVVDPTELAGCLTVRLFSVQK